MKKLFTTMMLLIIVPFFTFAKHEISLKLDKILEESNINEEMKPTELNTFIDNWFSIRWSPTPEGFNFVMENKTNTTLVINWDNSSFVNQKGTTSKIINGGVKFIDKAQSIPPTNIPLLAKIQDIVTPTDYWYFDTDKTGSSGWTGFGSGVVKWRNIPIWNDEMKDKDFEKIKDREFIFRVILNVMKGDETRNYHFFFKAVSKRV